MKSVDDMLNAVKDWTDNRIKYGVIHATCKKTSKGIILTIDRTFAELDKKMDELMIVKAENDYDESLHEEVSVLKVVDVTGEEKDISINGFVSKSSGQIGIRNSCYIHFDTLNMLTYTEYIQPGGNRSKVFFCLTSDILYQPKTSDFTDVANNADSLLTIEGAYNMYQRMLKCVETGEFTGATITVPLRLDACYLLVTREMVKSTGKIYGYRFRIYATPETRSISNASTIDMAKSTNSGVTLGVVGGLSSNSVDMTVPYGITIKATTTYRVSYALYELNNSYGNYDMGLSGIDPPGGTISIM